MPLHFPVFLIPLLCSLCILAGAPLHAAPPLAADLVRDGQPVNLHAAKFQQLFAELQQQHGFTAEALHRIFQGQTINRRVLVLMDKQAESRPYYQYVAHIITPERIRLGRRHMQTHRALLDRIEARFGVDREVVVAIWGIETRFGANQGGFGVLRTLTTLFDAYPRRSAFFRGELIAFLRLCRETGIDPKAVKGSYAGAFGQTQFMPSSYLRHAISFDGDSFPDVWKSTPDVLASIANYLRAWGWTLHAPIYRPLGDTLNDARLIAAHHRGRKATVPLALVRQAQGKMLPDAPGNRPVTIVGLETPPGKQEGGKRYVAGYPNFQAITAWNNSNRYAMAVSELAEQLAR
ncbi:MAG: lytic murein transglycosylase [Desulfobulbus sp.]|jgi:membrane-bound lytic murein transglycosylase B